MIDDFRRSVDEFSEAVYLLISRLLALLLALAIGFRLAVWAIRYAMDALK